MKLKYKALIALACIIAILLAYSIIVEPNFMVHDTRLTLKLEGLPEAFNGFRIVHITDTHFGMWHLPIRDDLVIHIIEKFKPDLIVFTGDLICSVDGVNEALKFASHLTSIAPTIMVLGNWDYWSRANIAELLRELEGLGVIVLINNSTRIARGGAAIYIVGVDDPYTWRDNLTKALTGIPKTSFKILLAHSPQIIDEARGKVNLILAGHTHGGQVNIPLIGPLFVPLPLEYREYVYGLYNESGTLMYVSRGIGCSMLPMRFMCPPEVVLITLVKA